MGGVFRRARATLLVLLARAAAGSDGLKFTPRPHRPGEAMQHGLRFIPAEASIRDALAVGQGTLGVVLGARDEVTFDHQGCNSGFAGFNLLGEILRNGRLSGRILATVGMAAVDHDPRRQTFCLQQVCCLADMFC